MLGGRLHSLVCLFFFGAPTLMECFFSQCVTYKFNCQYCPTDLDSTEYCTKEFIQFFIYFVPAGVSVAHSVGVL